MPVFFSPIPSFKKTISLDTEQKIRYRRRATMEDEMYGILFFPFPILRDEKRLVLYDRHAKGVFVSGDPSLLRFGRLHKWLRKQFDITNVAVFKVGPQERLRGYRFGIAKIRGDQRLDVLTRQDEFIAVPVDDNPFHAFVTDPRGEEEGRLTFVRFQTTRSALDEKIPIVTV